MLLLNQILHVHMCLCIYIQPLENRQLIFWYFLDLHMRSVYDGVAGKSFILYFLLIFFNL